MSKALSELGSVPAGSNIPPRASLLGLPAELRLQIYDYVLHDSRASLRRFAGRKSRMHCCASGSGGMYNTFGTFGCKHGPRNCTCTIPIAIPFVMGVCTTIAEEIGPMMLADKEALLRLPKTMSGSQARDALQSCAAQFPAYARPHISNVVLVMSSHGDLETIDDQWWRMFGRYFMGVSNLRLHLDGECLWWRWAKYDIFAGFLSLSGLDRVTLEVHQRRERGDVDKIEAFRRKLTAAIERKAVRVGRPAKFEVVGREKRDDGFLVEVISTNVIRWT